MDKATENKGFTPAPDTAKIDAKVVKKMVGEALSSIDGILDVKDSVIDVFKNEDDLTRGVAVSLTDDQQATVNAKIITETGKNIPNIVNSATDAITKALQNTAGLKPKDICIEVTDTMTKEQFDNRIISPYFYESTPPM